MIFDILDEATWNLASQDKTFVWNDKKLLNKDNEPHTEKDIVGLVRALFKFLERNSDIIPRDEKINMTKNLLNRMENPEYYAQLQKQREEEFDNSMPDGLFNPRNPETYKFAKINKPLVIDGVQIFSTRIDAMGKVEKEVKENETEKHFVTFLSLLLNIDRKGRKWQKSVELVKDDFIKQGIESPNDQTPGYLDRINRLYKSMLNDSSEGTEQDQGYTEQDCLFINKHIKQRIAECSPKN